MGNPKNKELICLVKGHVVFTSGDGYFNPECAFCDTPLPLHPTKDVYKWFEAIEVHYSEQFNEDWDANLDPWKTPEKYFQHENLNLSRIKSPNYVRTLYMESCHAKTFLKLTGEALFHETLAKGKKHIAPHRMETVLWLLKRGWSQHSSYGENKETTHIFSIRTNVGLH